MERRNPEEWSKTSRHKLAGVDGEPIRISTHLAGASAGGVRASERFVDRHLVALYLHTLSSDLVGGLFAHPHCFLGFPKGHAHRLAGSAVHEVEESLAARDLTNSRDDLLPALPNRLVDLIRVPANVLTLANTVSSLPPVPECDPGEPSRSMPASDSSREPSHPLTARNKPGPVTPFGMSHGPGRVEDTLLIPESCRQDERPIGPID